MKFSLKSYLGRLIWEGEAESTKAAVLAAFRAGADLSGADAMADLEACAAVEGVAP